MLMKIDKILVEESIQEHILRHGIRREEFENALLEGKPKVIGRKDNRYKVITHYNRYITVIFDYEQHNIAIVKTAYPSDDSQIRRYKKK